jgi:hypothetical protein
MAKIPERPKKGPKGDYEVGYGRPPKHSQAKKGQVLNPWGRNGKKASEPDAFDKVRVRLSRVTVDGEVMMVPSDEAFYLLQMARAMAGDKTASRIVAHELAARRRVGPAPPTAAELAQAEAEEAEKRALAARLVGLLDEAASAKRNGLPRTIYRDGKFVPIRDEKGSPLKDDTEPSE